MDLIYDILGGVVTTVLFIGASYLVINSSIEEEDNSKENLHNNKN
jgi:hypothetical protein